MMITTALYCPDNKTRDQVRKIFNIDQVSIERDLKILREWIKQEAHLPQDIPDDFLEKCLLRNKFSVERTKEKLENFYTMRGIHSKTFSGIEILLPSQTTDLIMPLPELTDQQERIIVIKINEALMNENWDVMKFFKHAMCAGEYNLRTDYVAATRIVQDFQNFTFGHFKKYATRITAYSTFYQEAYFSRISGIEYINLPSFVDVFMQACKALIKPKVFQRITVHKSLESLHKNVDRKFLPKEYGGDGKTIKEYLALWDKEFEANLDFFEKVITTDVSNEALRVGEVKFNAIFGTNGTFKTLNLD